MNLRITFFLVLALIGVFTSTSPSAENTPKLFPITEFGPGFPQPGSVKGGFIDETGKVIIPLSADYFPLPNPKSAKNFAEGLEPVTVGMKTKWPPTAWGYLDTKGSFAIEPQFESATPFAEGLAAVRDKKDGPPWSFGYIDHTGRYAIAPQFEQAQPFNEGLAYVEMPEHHRGFIDHGGKWVIRFDNPNVYATDFSEGLSRVYKGIPSSDGPTQTNPYYTDILFGYIDKTGSQTIDFKFKEAEAFHEGLAAINDPGGCGYIDKTGAFVIQPQFSMGWNFSEGIARVKTKDGKMAYINKHGDVVFTVPAMQWADEFSEGLANAKVRTGPGQSIWGYIDHTGNFVIKPQFQMAKPFVNGLAFVVVNGESGYIDGYIDKSGRFVWKVKMPNVVFASQ